MRVLCVLSCVVSGGPDIVLITHSGRPALVYLSSVLIHSMFSSPQVRCACLRTRSARGSSDEVGGLDFVSQPLGASGSELAFQWHVARYSWDIEEAELRVGFRPAENGLNRGPYQPSVSW